MSFRICDVPASVAVATFSWMGHGQLITKPTLWVRLVYDVVIPDLYYVYLLTVGIQSRCGWSYIMAHSHFGLLLAEVVVFRIRVVAYICYRMVTR